MLPLNEFRFSIVRDIGAGGLGTVDEIEIILTNCTQKPVGSRWARKRLNDRWKDEPTAQARFEREIAALRKMQHQAIVPFEGENLPGGQRFYVMPVYERSLRQRLAATPAGWHWREVAKFGGWIADAMAYAHDQGFIHRDLKPENILYDGSNNAVIADWGLGYFVHKESKVLQHLTRGGMGTEYYCSMEQWNTGKCGPTGDVYSLGVILAELITGRQNYMRGLGMGFNYDIITNDNSDGARIINGLLRSMTELDPGRRPQSMYAVSAQLTQARANYAVSAATI